MVPFRLKEFKAALPVLPTFAEFKASPAADVHASFDGTKAKEFEISNPEDPPGSMIGSRYMLFLLKPSRVFFQYFHEATEGQKQQARKSIV